MAKAKVVRKAWLRKGTGKNRGRTCVAAEWRGRKPFRKASNKRFYGCFSSVAKAERRKASVERTNRK